MFPVYSSSGRIVKFYTRPFSPLRDGTKYVSTSKKHPLFDPYNSLFGFYQCRDSKIKHKEGIIGVEGHIDVLAMHTYGLDNTVGLSGSSLDQQYLEILKRFGITIFTIIYDGDQPGFNAARELAASDIKSGSIDIRINYMTDGTDPAEHLRKNQSSDAISGIAKASRSLPIFYIDNLAHEYTLDGNEAKIPYIPSDNAISFLRKAANYIFAHTNIETDLVIRRVAEWLKISEDSVKDYLYIYADNNAFANVPAEISILKQILEATEPVILVDASVKLQPDDFSVNTNNRLYAMILDRYRQTKTISYDWLIAEAGKSGIVGIKQYIDTHIIPSKVMEVEWCIDDIVDKARRRRAISMSNQIISRVSDFKVPVVQTIEELSGKVSTLIYADEYRIKSRDSMIDSANALYELRKSKDTHILGFPFGDRFPRGNDLIGGLELGKALLLSASTGVGKTNMLLNWYESFCMRPMEGFKPVKGLIIPLEMNPDELRFRLWAIHSGIGARKIEKGFKLTDEEQKRLDITRELDREYGPIISRPREPTVSAILHEINYWRVKEDVRVVAIDFIQRLSGCELTGGPRVGRSELYEVGAKLFADRAQIRGDIALILTSQLSDEAKKAGIEVEGGTSWAKSIPNYFDYHTILIRKSGAQVTQYGAQYGNRFIKFDKNRFGGDQVVVHAHLFNHEIPEASNYGNLRLGEIVAIKELEMQNDIHIIGLQDGEIR